MITVIRDNTKETYYTVCDNCGSELEYHYDDVAFEDYNLSLLWRED